MNTRNTSDYYKVLNVADSASPEEIKRAYRSAARRYHPDTGGLYSSEKDFSNLNEAYRILSDPDLRRSYDLKLLRKRTSHAQNRVRAKTATDFKQSKARPNSESSAKSVRFKVRKPGVGNEQGSSRVHSLSLWKKIKEKLKTLHRIPSYKRKVGAKAADKLLDHVVQIDALESIHGTIKEIEIVDRSDKRGLKRKTVKFRIPAGVSNGDVLKISKENNLSTPLRVKVKITPHAYFARENKDIVVRVPITFQEAAKGAVVDIPTMDGITKIAIPPSTKIDRPRLRLRNKGIVLPGGGRGHIIIETHIVAPSVSTTEQAQALELLEKAYAKNVRAGLPLSF